MTHRLIFVGVAALVIAGSAIGQARANEILVPVMVGGEVGFDACGTLGSVSGLKQKSNSTLSVRSGPGRHYQRIDGLVSGTRVWLCDRRKPWVGIVYGPPNTDCGVSTPSPVRQSYQGPCASGWVHEKYVELIAG